MQRGEGVAEEAMRTGHDTRLLIAVVTLAACALGYRRQLRSTNTSHESYEMSGAWEDSGSVEGGGGGSSTSWRSQNQLLLRREGGSGGLPVDCCPSTLEIIEPIGGVNQDGLYVDLYKEGDQRQRFYELSCRPDVEGKPCRFVDRRLHKQSRCVQKYSFTYAIIKKDGGLKKEGAFSASGWMMDYIRVRSGCSCEVSPRPKRKHRKSKKED